MGLDRRVAQPLLALGELPRGLGDLPVLGEVLDAGGGDEGGMDLRVVSQLGTGLALDGNTQTRRLTLRCSAPFSPGPGL